MVLLLDLSPVDTVAVKVAVTEPVAVVYATEVAVAGPFAGAAAILAPEASWVAFALFVHDWYTAALFECWVVSVAVYVPAAFVLLVLQVVVAVAEAVAFPLLVSRVKASSIVIVVIQTLHAFPQLLLKLLFPVYADIEWRGLFFSWQHQHR